MWTIIDIYGTINKEKLDLIKAKRNGLAGLETDLKQGLESALPKPVKLDVLKRINKFYFITKMVYPSEKSERGSTFLKN